MSNRTLNLPHNVHVTVAQPYAEGHVLTAVEADKFNNVFADSIRTAIMAKLKKWAEEAGFDAAAASAHFQTYADNYEFSTRSAKESVDPVEKEAHKIAKQQVLAAIRNKGGDPKNYTADQIADFVVKVLAHKPEIREEAARRIESSRAIAGDLLGDLL